MNNDSFFKEVRTQISKDRIEVALNLLLEFCEHQELEEEFHNHLILLSSQFENIQQRISLGLEYSNVEKNNITKGLLDFVSRLQDKSVPNLKEKKFNPKTNKRLLEYRSPSQIGVVTIGVGSLTIIAILAGVNVVLSIIIGVLISIIFLNVNIDL
jgi:hypothetical protein